MPIDPSQDYVARPHQPLDAIFLPKTIAVIGAKDTIGSVGRTIMTNLIGSFKGAVYPVNPKRDQVLGLKSYPTILDVPEPVDLAIIVTPAATVPDIVSECAQAGVKSAVIISAGFKELGPSGLELEHKILENAKKGKMRIIGPNCLGVMNPIYGMNASFAKGMAYPGNIAFISQSGAMCTAVLDWSFQEHIGFSAFVSVGSMADVDWGDLISYLGEDPKTQSILIYMETVGCARSFLSAAREIALEKPIIVIKPGRSLAAAKAAASHTGSLAGSDDVFDAALERAGVLRVDSISQLFQMTALLSRQPRPKGPRLAIITNAGGPSVLATDRAVMSGAEMATLQMETIHELNQFLPEAWSHSNPVDILGDAGPERFGKTIDVLAKDQNIDGLLMILSPQDVTDPVGTAECLRPYAKMGKPLLTSWMGGDAVKKGIRILNQAAIPTFEYPDDAAWAFATMWKYSKNLIDLYETPILLSDNLKTQARHEAEKLIEKVRGEGRTLLSEFESKQLLYYYGIPVVETLIARNVDQAVQYAERLQFPVVLKLFSETITHKTDVGGVKLNLHNAQEVSRAYKEIEESVSRLATGNDFQGVSVQKMIKPEGYELILGSTTDAQFGPVILFGTGGQLVEVFKDRALGIPPLNSTLARHLMEKTKIFEALKGVRGRESVSIEGLEKILVRFSQLIVENRWIKEFDINPLLASPDQLIALDARVVLYDLDTKLSDLPDLSIRPYPVEYVLHWKLKDGQSVIIRPIRPEDENLLIDFHKDLSENSVRQRYFGFMSLSERTAHERLIRICFNDFDREMGLVAELEADSDGNKKIIGALRLIKLPGTNEISLKLIISDPYHNQGLGKKMIAHGIDIAKQEKIDKVSALILAENEEMIALCKKFGFVKQKQEDPHLVLLALKN